MENDVTIKTIRKMAIIINNPPYHRTIDIGTCCCFKQSIDKYATKTITKVPMPPTPKQMKGIKIRSSNIHKEYLDEELANDEYDDDECDEEYEESYYDNNISRQEGIAINRRTIKNNKDVSSTTNNLEMYHKHPTEYTAVNKMKWEKTHEILNNINDNYFN